MTDYGDWGKITGLYGRICLMEGGSGLLYSTRLCTFLECNMAIWGLGDYTGRITTIGHFLELATRKNHNDFHVDLSN